MSTTQQKANVRDLFKELYVFAVHRIDKQVLALAATAAVSACPTHKVSRCVRLNPKRSRWACSFGLNLPSLARRSILSRSLSTAPKPPKSRWGEQQVLHT